MINYLNLIILLIVVMILVVLIIIIGHHFIIYWQEKKFKMQKEKWEPILYKYLDEQLASEEAAKVMQGDFYVLWRFLKTYFSNLKGDDLELLKDLVAETEMVDFFIEELETGNKREKVKAALALGKLQEQVALPYLRRLLYSDYVSVVVAAIRAIAEIGDTSLLVLILRVMFDQTHITFEGMMELLASFDDNICQPLMDILQEWLDGKRDLEETFKASKEEALSLIIDLLGYNRHMQAVEVFAEILKRESNEEVLIHIFKALARLEAPVGVDLTPFLKHKNWVIRSQASKYIATIKDENYSKQLEQLLSDNNWWVRYYAANALYNIGEIELLKKRSNSEKDGSDVSSYVLKQR